MRQSYDAFYCCSAMLKSCVVVFCCSRILSSYGIVLWCNILMSYIDRSTKYDYVVV